MKPALLVLAAGMGSRYGGLKQMDPISPYGETLLEFSVYDALAAGFGKAVLLIKREMEADFEAAVGARLRRLAAASGAEVVYAYQEKDDLPEGFSAPAGRVKPWGTGQALWAARHVIDSPFAVINADDFYGKEALNTALRFLTSEAGPDAYALVSYRLGNTLTEHGTVARGVCEVRDGFLTGITERRRIAKTPDGAAFTEDGETWAPLSPDTPVSMQLMAFHPAVFSHAGRYFTEYLTAHIADPSREYLLPGLLGEMLARGEAAVRVLQSDERWFGVTYAQDKPMVVEAIARLRRDGIYPSPLAE
ncbi:MAG: nucleotidyltransferase [Oscillospiraceae bacterium]|nr:nucleotidyltransferase [Oscillospiraceae bacterium]